MLVKAKKLMTSGPSDVSGLKKLFDSGELEPADVLCIIGKTEGNGGTNDFTRELAMTAFEDLFSRELGISRREVTDRVIFSMSGGCEGVVSPHIVVFARCEEGEARDGEKRLAIGIGFTRDFRPEEIGRLPQVEETARVIREVMRSAAIESGDDVHLVQMKGAIPSYTYEEGEAARKCGRPLRSDMVYSRGASALGAAVATGEVNIEDLDDDSICTDWSKFSSTASCSAKPGLRRTEVMVMGNSASWGGDLVIEGGTLEDMIDANSVRRVLRKLGMASDCEATSEDTDRIVGIFAKSEADPRGTIRGKRHTMLTDDDISDTRYSRCILGAVIASITGDTAVYISTRSEHHGPSGGGTIAVVARKAAD